MSEGKSVVPPAAGIWEESNFSNSEHKNLKASLLWQGDLLFSVSQSHPANINRGRVPQRQGQLLLNTLESFRNACRWGQVRGLEGWMLCVSMFIHPSVLVTEFLYPTPSLKYHRWVQRMALVGETTGGGICSGSENFVTPVCVSQENCLGPITLFHIFGLGGTAWKLAKTGDDVRLEGTCEAIFLCPEACGFSPGRD